MNKQPEPVKRESKLVIPGANLDKVTPSVTQPVTPPVVSQPAELPSSPQPIPVFNVDPPVAAQVVPIIKAIRKASPTALIRAEQKRTIYRHVPEAGIPIEEVMDPSYFSLLARYFVATDRIEIIPQDMNYYAELLVTNVLSHTVVTELLIYKQVSKSERRSYEDAEYSIKWQGVEAKYAIYRKVDNANLKNGFMDIMDAQKWLIDYQKAFRA